MSLLDGDGIPTTTGSIAAPVDVQQPLPPTLAYSDATKIGQAATAALAGAEGTSAEDWVNSSTGSSGTLQAEALAAAAGSENCRHFTTIVTSIGGVHQYSAAVCPRNDGPAIVQIGEQSKDDRS